jgi:hypothetical protein
MAKETPQVAALNAAVAALGLQLQAQAEEQGGYLHKFEDGRLSIELEWICPRSLAKVAVVEYLAHAANQNEDINTPE